MNMTYVQNVDCIQGLKAIGNDVVDLIFTDPPYGIDGDKFDARNYYKRDRNKVIPGYMEISKKNYESFTQSWISECARVLRPGGSIYILSGNPNLHHILHALYTVGLEHVNHLAAQYTFAVYTKNKFVSDFYHIVLWQKKDSTTQKRTFNTHAIYLDKKESYHDRSSVQPMDRITTTGNKVKNQNQLPIKFIEKFILYSSNKGDVVLDPFCGSFSTGIAALKHGRNFIGFEVNKHAFDTFSPSLKNIEIVDARPLDQYDQSLFIIKP